MVQHVVQLFVWQAIGLPALDSLSSSCGGAFIKYLFPGEEEPLFTQVMQWGPMVYFGASVHHQISLPTGLYICDHLRENAVDEHLDLIFELWASLAMTSKCERSRENNYIPAWKLTNTSGHHDKKTQKTTTRCLEELGNKHCEIYIGRAILLHQTLLELLDQKECSTEVRKTFNLPLTLVRKLPNTYFNGGGPELVVHINYSSYKLGAECLLHGTIFDNHEWYLENMPLQAELEIKIIQATYWKRVSTVAAATGPTSSGTRSGPSGVFDKYIRFSLFPAKHELELIYEPLVMPLKPRKHPDLHTTWRDKISLSLDAMVLKELRTSHMSFEVWQCSQSSSPILGSSYPNKNPPTDLSSAVWLGTASVPCLPLLLQKEGTHGCYSLVSHTGKAVGELEVAIHFTKWCPSSYS